jgi:hypothetical protein
MRQLLRYRHATLRPFGLRKAEIIRRGVRLLANAVKEPGSVGFILYDLLPLLTDEIEGSYGSQKDSKIIDIRPFLRQNFEP